MANILSLEEFRRAMGLHPWHFHGLANSLIPEANGCGTIFPEYSWQKQDVVGRSEVREAIEIAESKLADYLGYYPAPHYASATLPFPPYMQRDMWRTAYADGSGRLTGVRLPEGKVLALGTEKLALIGQAPVSYVDLDGDGLNESFSLAISLTDTSIVESEIALFFQDGDVPAEFTQDRREVAPILTEITSGIGCGGCNIATVTGKAWTLVRPILYEGVLVPDDGIDPSVIGNFVVALDVYRRTTDGSGNSVTTSQSTLHWEAQPWPDWCTVCTASGGGSSDPGLEAQAVARCGIRDSENGIVLPAEAVYNSTAGTWSTGWDLNSWCRLPDRVTVRYRAGVARDSRNQISRPWQTLIARMACAEVGRPIYACAEANREVYRWQFDLAQNQGANDEAYGFTPQSIMDCPLGTRRGQVWAYQQIQNLQQLPGVAVG